MTGPPVAPPERFAVVSVGDTAAPPPDCDLGDVVDWYRHVSGGVWAPKPDYLPPLRLDHRLARYASQRGLDPAAPNSRDLVAAAVAGISEEARARIADAGGRLLLLVAGGIAPHVWYPARGGLPLGGRRWCRRFAVLPAASPLGTRAHEIGHLLPGWPEGCPSAREHCLMACGGLRAGGSDPAPPAAPLALAAGWRTPLALTPATRVSALLDWRRTCGVVLWRGHHILAEFRDSRLLAWHGPANRPALAAALPVKDLSLPVLGLLAPALRRLPGATQRAG